jgi:transposase
MRRLGEDVTEVLEYVPARFKVIRHIRPKFSCRACETITQAPMPSVPIERGRPGPGLLAHVLVSKCADHLPLYRQAEIYARQGVELDAPALADWVGKAALAAPPAGRRAWSRGDERRPAPRAQAHSSFAPPHRDPQGGEGATAL